jgi:protein-disulfide isomerase
MRTVRKLIWLFIGALFLAVPAFGQSSEEGKSLRQAIDALTERQQRIERELQEIKALLAGTRQSGPVEGEPKNLLVSIGDGPAKGDHGARIVLVEFTDYQCPFCARHARETLPQIEKEYVKSGKIQYVVRDLPLESIHPHAFRAAEAAHCAGAQGKYWDMHRLLFGNQRALGPTDLVTHAGTLSLDVDQFQACLKTGIYADRVRRDLAEGQKAGLRGTPSFLLGRLEDGKLRVERVLRGAQPFNAFKVAIEAALLDR